MKFGINLLISSLIIFKTLFFFFNYNLGATGFASETLIWYNQNSCTTPVIIPIADFFVDGKVKFQQVVLR